MDILAEICDSLKIEFTNEADLFEKINGIAVVEEKEED